MKQISCYADAASLRDHVRSLGRKAPNLTEAKHAQIYFLYHVAHIPRKQIALITGYSAVYLSKMRNNVANYAELAAKLFIDTRHKATNEPVSVSLNRRCGNRDVPMNMLAGAGADSDRTNKVYLFKFYDDFGKIIFTKIGTTTRTCEGRLRDEIGYYINKGGYPINYVDICRIYETGDIVPELVESAIRANLGKDYMANFKNNDRFMHTDIPTTLFDKLFHEYMN